VFGVVHESESDSALVTSSEDFAVHVDNFGGLSNDSTVNNSLIVSFDESSVVQNGDLGFKVEDRCGLGSLINEDHTLSEHVALKLLFWNKRLDGEANCLSSEGFFDLDSLVMNASNTDGLELTCFIRSEQESLLRNDCSRQHGTSDYHSNTRYLVDTVDEEFYWV
jgi:hypothetical protein